MTPAEIHYKVRWRASSHLPGHHASQQQGGGLEFRHHAPLIDAPDPRRFDVRASLRDPFGQIQVRIYRQTSAIPVYVVADLSASMAYRGEHAKLEVLARLVEALGYSAYRSGDRFGFVGCGTADVPPWVVPATMNRSAGPELAVQLRGHQPDAPDSDGLLLAGDWLGARRALVFLVSDFHFPLETAERVLASLAYHDVVPVVLWDDYEYQDLPHFGLVRVFDPETRRARLLLMRPGLRRRIERNFAARGRALFELFARHGRAPLVLAGGFDADAVTAYFYH